MAASSGRILLWTLLGGVFGTALGEILARLLPVNSLTRFLTASVALGTSHPLTLDLRIVELTLGLLLRVSLLGLVGTAVVFIAQLKRS
jgi:uncharacterized protein DUF4321